MNNKGVSIPLVNS